MEQSNYIFISYKGEDPQALHAIDVLRRRGYRVWCDRRIAGGASWLQDIAEHIQDCRCFLSLLTEAYLESKWCMSELLTAKALGKPVTPAILAEDLTMALRLATEELSPLRRDQFASENAFFDALCKREGFSDCFGEAMPAPLSMEDGETPDERALSALRLTCEVKRLGEDTWQPRVKAQLGDVVRFRVHGVNGGDILQENLHVRDILPTGLSYVKGSTSVANSTNPKGIGISDNLVTDSGCNLGHYNPGGGFWLYFNAAVDPAAYRRDQNLILRNVVQISGGRATGTVEAIADVLIDRQT